MITFSSKRILLLAGTGLLIASGSWFCSPAPEKTETADTDMSAPKTLTPDELVARGKYLVTTASCHDCHSPKIMTPEGPMPDSTRLLSGHPANSPLPAIPKDATKPGNWVLFSPDLTASIGPWGMAMSANLTPDSATGTGAWTVDQFIATIRNGKHLGQPGGRPLSPPMPWQMIRNFTDQDLTAIFTYIHTLPAIHNLVPPPVPPDQVGKK